VKDGKIPPEIDMVRPFWFEVLYRDQLDGPVDIRGTIRAPRATSYDYVVEWAPGVQPLDDAFQAIASEENVPGGVSGVITGGDEPIARFDVRTIDTTHVPDPDSKYGENQYTITVRIRAVAHYGGSIGDVRGEMRRNYYVHSDPTLVKGFPIYIGDSGEASPGASPPKVPSRCPASPPSVPTASTVSRRRHSPKNRATSARLPTRAMASLRSSARARSWLRPRSPTSTAMETTRSSSPRGTASSTSSSTMERCATASRSACPRCHPARSTAASRAGRA
jgi:hypothetical protein